MKLVSGLKFKLRNYIITSHCDQTPAVITRLSLRAITDGGEFTIHVKGVILGEALDWRGTWSPRNTLAFIFELCAKLWSDFLADVGRLM